MEKGAEKIAEVNKSPWNGTVDAYSKMKMENSLWAEPILDQYGSIKMLSNNQEFLRSLKRKRPMCEYVVDDDDEEITLMEFRKRMKKEQKKEQKKKKKTILRRQVSIRSVKSKKKKKSKLEEENKNKLEEENKNKNKVEEEEKPIPVFEGSFRHFPIDSGTESEEEVLHDGERDEYDWGCKYVVNENAITYTRLKHPIKVYYRRSLRGSVLHCEHSPVPTVTKLALDRYNAIEGTNYKYVGLVKAYRTAVCGSHYTVRFKARLPAQRPIDFQAMIWLHILNSKNEALVDVKFVHPLP